MSFHFRAAIVTALNVLLVASMLSFSGKGGPHFAPVDVQSLRSHCKVEGFENEPFPLRGPLPWAVLSQQLRDMYTLNGTVVKDDWYFYMDGLQGENMPAVIDYEINATSEVWAKDYLEGLMERASRRDTDFATYEGAGEDVYAAFDAYPATGKLVLVIGSIFPWIEVQSFSHLRGHVCAGWCHFAGLYLTCITNAGYGTCERCGESVHCGF